MVCFNSIDFTEKNNNEKSKTAYILTNYSDNNFHHGLKFNPSIQMRYQ